MGQTLISLLDTGFKDFKNAPLAVQLVGMRQEDDRLMGVAKIVDAALNASSGPSQL